MENFDRMRDEVFNVGDGSMNYTKREVALAIREHVDYYLHEAPVGTDPDQRDYEVDYSKLRSLGYRPNVNLDLGVQELIKILRVLMITNTLRNA
jgi:nucleoside-diphosphate-sugar epimerase